jgi:hypothetical protein
MGIITFDTNDHEKLPSSTKELAKDAGIAALTVALAAPHVITPVISIGHRYHEHDPHAHHERSESPSAFGQSASQWIVSGQAYSAVATANAPVLRYSGVSVVPSFGSTNSIKVEIV